MLDIATSNFFFLFSTQILGKSQGVIASVSIDNVLRRVVLYASKLSILVVAVDGQAIQCFKVVQYEADVRLKRSDRVCDMKRINPS